MRTIILGILIITALNNVFSQKNTYASESVDIEFKTVTNNGQHSPDHVLAVWIEDASGNFVRTVTKRGVEEDYYLFKWKLASYGNTTDAISGATLTLHQTHQYIWDCMDKNGNLVVDGVYSVNIEFTESDSQGPITKINFTKGDTNLVTQADEAYYKSMTVHYSTDISSVSEIESERLIFSINPNPATDYLQISAYNIIDKIEIYNIQGKSIYTVNNVGSDYRINVSELTQGVYFVYIKSANNFGVKKVLIN